MSSVVNCDDENARDEPDDSSDTWCKEGHDACDVADADAGLEPAGAYTSSSDPPPADAELVAMVRIGGELSAEYRYLKRALEEVAIGTMTKLDKARQLHQEVKKKGCQLWLPVPFSYPAHFRTILTLAVLTASPKFMNRQILGGGWQPDRKASVRTFFVSAAMFEFAAEYNRFWQEENPSIPVSNDEIDQFYGVDRPDSEWLTSSYGPNVEDLVANRDRIARIADEYLCVPGVHPHLADIIVRTAQQYTQVEIADDLGISADAVSGAIRRFRRRLS